MSSDINKSFVPDSAVVVVKVIECLFSDIVTNDVPSILGHYLHHDRLLVFLEGPVSAMSGFDEKYASDAWTALLASSPMSKLELSTDLRAGVDGKTGWVTGTIDFSIQLTPTNVRSDQSRGTWILEQIDDTWLIVAEHVSFPLDDPYKVGNNAPA